MDSSEDEAILKNRAFLGVHSDSSHEEKRIETSSPEVTEQYRAGEQSLK